MTPKKRSARETALRSRPLQRHPGRLQGTRSTASRPASPRPATERSQLDSRIRQRPGSRSTIIRATRPPTTSRSRSPTATGSSRTESRKAPSQASPGGPSGAGRRKHRWPHTWRRSTSASGTWIVGRPMTAFRSMTRSIPQISGGLRAEVDSSLAKQGEILDFLSDNIGRPYPFDTVGAIVDPRAADCIRPRDPDATRLRGDLLDRSKWPAHERRLRGRPRARPSMVRR